MKRFICSVMAASMLFLTACSDTTTTQAKVDSKPVYITETGGKYHRWSCRYLKDSCYEISLSKAIASGYTACSVCKP